jgi:hypothetical protein
MGCRRGAYKVLLGRDLGEGDHLEDQGIDGRITLEMVSTSGMGGLTGFVRLKTGTSGG